MQVTATTALAASGSRAAKPQQVLDAARTLFLRDGFSATSMDAVAKEAGVSKATVYAHYKSKEELFAGIIHAECTRSWPETLGGVDMEAIDPIEKLREIAGRYVRFINGSWPISVLRTVAAEAKRSPELGRLFYESGPDRGRRAFAGLLAAADAKGLLRIPDPLQATDTFFAMLRGDIHLRCLVGLPAPSEAELAAHAEAMTEMFLRLHRPARESA
jgi:AcrR family transcriptional regulator